MKMTLTRPCGNCPFRTDVTPYIRGARAVEIADAITRRQGTFSCHKTVNHNDDEGDEGDEAAGNHIPTAEEQHCAGALIMLEHMEQPNQLMRIYERLRAYDRTKLDMTSPVYTTARAFITAHRRRDRESAPSVHTPRVRGRQRR